MKRELKFKNFKIDNIQKEEGQLIIAGWAARFGNIDSYGDVIQMGAFARTLTERKGRIAFCYQHEIDEPIGKILLLEERPEGLWIEVAISASEDDIQTKIKEGILNEMSIGYSTINSNDATVDGRTVCYLTEIKLYEVSLVTIAANPLATIEAMKGEEVTTHFDESFDRLIITERDNNRKFDLLKLKSQVIALLHKEPEEIATPKQEPPKKEVLTKDEILSILRN